jgi:hypothetical protein
VLCTADRKYSNGDNERTKLTATWLNTMATALVAGWRIRPSCGCALWPVKFAFVQLRFSQPHVRPKIDNPSSRLSPNNV